MLEVELTGQRGRAANGNGRNGNKTDAASEAFARWLHRRYAPVEQPSAAAYIAAPYLVQVTVHYLKTENYPLHCVSHKTTLAVYTTTSMHIN